jgi:ABC-2 type transport system ATP-binding protein
MADRPTPGPDIRVIVSTVNPISSPHAQPDPLRDVRGQRRAGSPAIIASGLVKTYGEVRAVDALSFTVDYGRVVGFLGPNGAGKTTTLRMLLGLIRPTAGTATIAGRRYQELAAPWRHVGALLSADTAHPGRTGVDHLRVLARAAGMPKQRADELVELVGLGAAARRRVGGYSLGMRQRLGLAAALLGDPEALVLDEPANGLDPEGIHWLRDLLTSFAADGRAVLVSSHVLSEVAQMVDDVVIMRSGRPVLQAPLADLLARGTEGVRVTGPDTGRLAELLRREGAGVTTDGPGRIVVADRDQQTVLHAISRHQLKVSEITPVGRSLEQVYLDLTTDSTSPANTPGAE